MRNLENVLARAAVNTQCVAVGQDMMDNMRYGDIFLRDYVREASKIGL